MLEPSHNDELPVIPGKRYFTIGEVSELCAVKPHVLRYWEQEFPQLNPVKRTGNRRYYQRQDVLMIRQIRALLYDQGFTISGARLLMPLACLVMAVTLSPLLGAAAYWSLRAFFMMGQALWFAFSMETGDSQAKAATSAWLNITYWLGNAVTTPIVGLLIARSNYGAPFFLAVATGLAGSALTFFFFHSFDGRRVSAEPSATLG